MNEIVLNNETYIKKADIERLIPATADENGEYCIIRTYSAGVFAGYIESRDGKEAVVRHARRIWYWSGAASLSQLATDGTTQPDKCKFPCEVDKVILTEVIEIITCTEKAKGSIKGVPEWKM